MARLFLLTNAENVSIYKLKGLVGRHVISWLTTSVSLLIKPIHVSFLGSINFYSFIYYQI